MSIVAYCKMVLLRRCLAVYRPAPTTNVATPRYPGHTRQVHSRRVHQALISGDRSNLSSHMLSQQWVPSTLSVPSYALVSLYMHDHFMNIGGSSRHRTAGLEYSHDPISALEQQQPLFNGLPQLATIIPTLGALPPYQDWQAWSARLSFNRTIRSFADTSDPEPTLFATSGANMPPVSGRLPSFNVPLEPIFLTTRLIFSRAPAAPLVAPRVGVAVALACNLGPVLNLEGSTPGMPGRTPRGRAAPVATDADYSVTESVVDANAAGDEGYGYDDADGAYADVDAPVADFE